MQLSHARTEYKRWLLATRDLSPHTIRAYDGDIAAFANYIGARARVSRIDQEWIIAFLEQQRAAGLSGPSLRRRASGLRGFCRWLHSGGHLKDDPWLGTTVGAGRSRTLPRIVPTRDLNRLLRHLLKSARLHRNRGEERILSCPHEATTLLAVAVMVATGVRVAEVVAIQVDAIDLPSRGLRLVGKGRRERQVFLTNDWITSLVRAYLRTRAQLHVECSQLLFNRHLQPLSPAAMRSRLARAADDAGVAAHITPHMLRHTAATQLLDAGVDIRYIQRLLGHASLSTTEIYTHVSDRALRRVVSQADVIGHVIGE
jgi:site-specific recombinase XerD